MAQDINPTYAGLERSCPRDFKNVSHTISNSETGFKLMLRLEINPNGSNKYFDRKVPRFFFL